MQTLQRVNLSLLELQVQAVEPLPCLMRLHKTDIFIMHGIAPLY